LSKNGLNVLNDLNLDLKEGEIHGICGVEGNGQSEIVDVIIGFEENFRGEYRSFSKKISLVPDDRIKKGMIKEYSIGENMILRDEKSNFITGKFLKQISDHIITKYDVKVSDNNAALNSLSGGNQQKVVFAREIETGSDILILSHPSRGVDINATLFIHNKIIEEKNRGKSILLISSDLDELISLSDKLSVLYNGKIIKTFDSTQLKTFQEDKLHLEIDSKSNKPLYEEIGRLMIGITQ
jgi:simple sugar transport system ATP-binding protein